MAAEIRVDTIKGRSGINTISLDNNTVYFENSVGIGTTNALNAASSSNTRVLNVGVVTANYYYGDGTNLVGVVPGNKTTIGITTTEAVGIATFNAALYRSARARVQITQGSDYQISELHLVHDGTTASFVEPATIATGSLLGDFSVGIGTGAYELKVSMVSVSSATVEAYLERLAV
jgi:hypothetical protein